MLSRSNLAVLASSFVLVGLIFAMAWDSYNNVRTYLDSVAAESGAFAPCQYEDGSGPTQEFPCYWDASTQGNLTGKSFVMHSPDHVSYLN